MKSNTKTYNFLTRAKPFFAVVFLQFGLAGMDILSKVALNEGMSNYVFVVYRHAIATAIMAPFAIVLDKKVRPKMTWSIFWKLALLGLLEPVIDQNLYFLGMKLTTATFAAAMCNVLPAITFVMACICRLEKLNMKSINSQAKVIGIIATVGGAMIMTLVTGTVIMLPWTKEGGTLQHIVKEIALQDYIKGALMITAGCFSWGCFMILQAVTLKSYPVELSVTAWICSLGTFEGAILALIMERGNAAVWSIKWDSRFLAAVYSGVFCSGLAYYIQGIIMKERGPVFVTAFSPLSMVIVAVVSSFILAEKLYLGRLLGAITIVFGLYLVVWGKRKDYDDSPSIGEEATGKLTINEATKCKAHLDHELVAIDIMPKERSENEV